MKKQVYKPYKQNQPMLMPPSLRELIPVGHLVRVVNEMIDQLDIEPLKRQYKGGGTSAYHPRMLLKVIIYAYTQRVFSSRRIAKELRENVNYMWLSGMTQPDHRTINRFRGEIMKKVVEEVFYGIVEQLLDMGYIDLGRYFVDGTKLEANANRYSFVWRKSTKKYRAGLQEKVSVLLDEIEEIEEAEEKKYGERDLEEVGEGKEINAEELKEAVEKINEVLKKDPKNKKLKKAKRALEKDFIPRQEKYERYEKTFKGRNSFSKTDEDATFMRMKEDHMRNARLQHTNGDGEPICGWLQYSPTTWGYKLFEGASGQIERLVRRIS
jgi:transposase